jgi:hypothetical protein
MLCRVALSKKDVGGSRNRWRGEEKGFEEFRCYISSTTGDVGHAHPSPSAARDHAVQDEGEGDGRTTPLSFHSMEKETLVPLHRPSVE